MEMILKQISYYLSTDRLGSGSAVTDGRGRAVHILGYMPYCETLLDLSQRGYEIPYQIHRLQKRSREGGLQLLRLTILCLLIHG